MLEVGKFYKSNITGNSYKCLKVENGMATLWVYVELPPDTYFPFTQKDGSQEMARTVSAEYTQELQYQDQYKLITDMRENSRLSTIYDRQNNIRRPILPIRAIAGLTEELFNKVMKQIDEELQMENPKVPGREIRAIPKLAQKLDIDNFPLYTTDITPGVYTTDNIATHSYEWFKKKYGKKLNMQNNLAHMILAIKGTFFRVGFPIVYGTIKIVFDSPLRRFNSIGQNGERAIFNLAAYIEDLTPTLVSDLTQNEVNEIISMYGETYNAILKYQRSSLRFQQEALADLETAVDSFFYVHQQYGQSKWASLQFTEKLLKGVIANTGAKFKYSHELEALAQQVKSVSGIDISLESIKRINCKAEVRYAAEIVSPFDAISAHHASLEVLRCVMEHFSSGAVNNGELTNA